VDCACVADIESSLIPTDAERFPEKPREFSQFWTTSIIQFVFTLYTQQATTKPIYTCQTLGTRLKPSLRISPFLPRLSPTAFSGEDGHCRQQLMKSGGCGVAGFTGFWGGGRGSVIRILCMDS